MSAMLKGVIDDGTREIPLYNKFNKLICNIYIRPADFSIVDRYNKLVKEIPEITKPLESISIKNDGTPEFDAEWEIIKQAEKTLKDKINELFDMDEADDIFAKRNPFSSVGGEFFALRVINGIQSIISEAIEEEAKASKKRMSKYLKKIKTDENDNTEAAPDDNGAAAENA